MYFSNKNNPALIASIGVAVVCSLNFYLSISPAAIILSVIAAGLFFLYTLFSSVDNSSNTDYILSGEGSSTLLFFIIGFRFITDNINLIFPLTVFLLIIITVFLQKVYSQNASLYILNPLAILIVGYLFFFDRQFNINFLQKTITGLAEKNYETVILFFIFIIISFIFSYKSGSTAIIISHGKEYSENLTGSAAILKYFFMLFKSLLIVSAVFISGISGFAAYYIYRFSYRGKINIIMIFYFILIQLSVLLALKFAAPAAVLSAVIALSIISHFIYKLNKVNIYDRSIRYKL